jgi:hypothetical protein
MPSPKSCSFCQRPPTACLVLRSDTIWGSVGGDALRTAC